MNERETIQKTMNDIDEPMPARVHAQIMRRVFLAGYGKYLIFSASILLLNLGVLGLDLYRSLTSENAVAALSALRTGFAMTPAYLAAAIGTLYSILPFSSIVATALTAALSGYIAVVFVRVYRNPQGVQLLKKAL
ncbi:MAG: hypothetical protein KGH68_03000 [Patescibacteria group bacterium]|nr:hypothetical protein [Patescibacteria group bacterium]